jgi:hypothetical protein
MAKKTSSAAGKIAGGLGLAALAAGAAAAYYFTGKGGKQNRKKVSAWTHKAKTDMVSEMKKMKTVSKAAYEKAAKEVLAKYKQAKNIDPKEFAALGHELKGHWNSISKKVSKLGTAGKKK